MMKYLENIEFSLSELKFMSLLRIAHDVFSMHFPCLACDSIARLTRNKISDRVWERGWLQTERSNYTKATHRSGRGSLQRLVS